MQEVQSKSKWWFLFPILFNITGGAISYFILRHEDPRTARNCLYLGAVLAAPWIITVLVLSSRLHA